jgi:hypothetical protein
MEMMRRSVESVMDESVMDQRHPEHERRLAQRFALQLPIRYRAIADVIWQEAHTENVGKSGVFFRHDATLDVDTPIEMVLSLPVELGGELGATTHCRGRIVRVEARTGLDPRLGMAATIESFSMTHGDPRRVQ